MKKKIMTMLLAATCLASTSLNSAVAVSAAEKSDTSFLMGDVNEDGSFGVSDVVLLQKWLLAVPDTHLANWRAADFCEDEKLDVFDLTLMKRELLKEINNPDEPPATEIAPLEFNSTDDAVKAINANDLSDYYSPYREAYESMFKQFREEGFVYSVKTNDNVALAENSKIRLFPDHALEDMCIKYSVMYQGKKYNISFRCANMDVISETNGITEYVNKRWGSKTDHEIMIGDKTYTISNATDGSQIAAMAFIDVTHYIQVIGFDSVAEEELTELLNALEYEKISLNTIGEPPADLIAPLGFQTADDAIKEIIQSEYSIIEGYAQMFERFRNDGFIYHFTDAENAITLREDRTNAAVWLMPYDYFEDTGIRYNVVYQGKDYQVYYYFTDPAFPASDLWDYMEQRLHTENINVVDGKYGIVDHNNGGNPVVSAYFAIDDTHYCKIRTYEPEEALMDFLQVLDYEKLDIADNSIPDPITPVTAQPIGYKDTEAAIEAIHNNDVNAYPEQYYYDYRKMFERFQNDGFIYQVTDNDLITTNKERGTTLFPSASYEDVGVGYFVTFKGNNYHILFYSADADVLAETDGIAAYLKKRMGRNSDKEITVSDKTVSLLLHENGQRYANAFVDENHYFDVIGAVSEEEMTEFLNAFAYEKTVF